MDSVREPRPSGRIAAISRSPWPLLAPLALLALLAMPEIAGAQDAEVSPARAIESEVLEHLAGGRQFMAERLLADALKTHGDDQALVFLRGCCKRSRFDMASTWSLMLKVQELDPDSLAGLCATEILYLDSRRAVSTHFTALEKLADEHPEEPLPRWMIAVQCRAFDWNEEGIAHYRRLLELWQPGPSMVHHTYANLFSELDREEEALVERRIAVEMEPAAFALRSLGNTLKALERYEEASEAYGQTVELDPQNRRAWKSWAATLMHLDRFEEAVSKSERAARLDPENFIIWRTWAFCLERLDRDLEALRNYREAIRLKPGDSYSIDRETALAESMPSLPPVAPLPDGYVDYGGHDLSAIMSTRIDDQGKESYFLEMGVVSTVMNDLLQHAKMWPVTFRTEPERRRAEQDVTVLASVIEVIAADEDADSELLISMGRVQAIRHNLDLDGAGEQAVAWFRRLLAREPEHVLGNYHFGVLLASTLPPDDDTAIPYLEKAIALGVDDAWYSLGMKYLTREDVSEALRCLETYASKRPDDKSVQLFIEALKSDELSFERVGDVEQDPR